jgi:hypothetical protein
MLKLYQCNKINGKTEEKVQHLPEMIWRLLWSGNRFENEGETGAFSQHRDFQQLCSSTGQQLMKATVIA